MAHNLSQHRDASGALHHSCFSLRANPWHQLGTVVQEPIASDQAQRLAGLAWDTKRLPLYTSEMDAVPEHYAVKRLDNQAILGVVGQKYVPLQNSELFTFLRTLANVGEDVIVESAGALGRGETVWALLRLADRTIRIGDDESACYLLATNGHCANRQLALQPTLVRVVCRNTLSAALAVRHGRRGTREGGFRIRHTSGLPAALGDVAAAYRGSVEAISELELAYRVLARTPLNEAMIRDTIDRAFRGDGEAAPSEADRAQSMRAAREDRIRAILASATCTVPRRGGQAPARLAFLTHLLRFRTDCIRCGAIQSQIVADESKRQNARVHVHAVHSGACPRCPRCPNRVANACHCRMKSAQRRYQEPFKLCVTMYLRLVPGHYSSCDSRVFAGTTSGPRGLAKQSALMYSASITT